MFELCLGGLQVYLPGSQAVRLLLKLGHTVARTLVWQCEPGFLLSKILTINVVRHVWWGIVINVIRVILRVVPRKDLEEGAERGDVGPHRTGEGGAPWRIVTDDVLQL
jgi:hypothetical protein